MQVTTGADELTVVVTDDGRGMQPRADSPGLGLGLPTIGRLAALVDLREPPGGGTELSMTFATPGVRGPVRVPRERLHESELLDAVARIAQGAWPGEGVERLVDLLVPGVADACAVDVIDASGYPERFAGRIDGSRSTLALAGHAAPAGRRAALRHPGRAGGRSPARLRAHAGPDRAHHHQRRGRRDDGRDRHPLVDRDPAARGRPAARAAALRPAPGARAPVRRASSTSCARSASASPPAWLTRS